MANNNNEKMNYEETGRNRGESTDQYGQKGGESRTEQQVNGSFQENGQKDRESTEKEVKQYNERENGGSITNQKDKDFSRESTSDKHEM
ncbi:MAG TPA: hypothetical protein VGI04_09625 [Neobacillus sp.]